MRQNHLYLLIFSLCLAGYFLIGFNYYKLTKPGIHIEKDIEVCIFKSLTGLPCPSCGTTRSVTSVAKGDIIKAIWWNPLGIIMSGAMILFPVWIVRDWILKGDSFYRFYKRTEQFLRKKPVAIISITLIIIIWGWNLYKFLWMN